MIRDRFLEYNCEECEVGATTKAQKICHRSKQKRAAFYKGSSFLEKYLFIRYYSKK